MVANTEYQDKNISGLCLSFHLQCIKMQYVFNHGIMDKLDNHYLKWRIITNVKTWKGLFIIFGSMKYWDLIGIGESNNCRYV